MSRTLFVLAAVAALLWTPARSWAGVLVSVDLGAQQMTVDVDGKRAHVWSVSTARSDYVTPTGSYRPQRMHKMWYSRKYDDAPMPHAIFYSGGYAIHGTTSVRMLGRPASHGCVRLAPANAAVLYALVQRKGMAATRIVIRGVPPKPRPAPVVAQAAPQTAAMYRPTVATLPPSSPGLLTGLLDWSKPAPPYAYTRPPAIRASAPPPPRRLQPRALPIRPAWPR
jgi:hypothetical protein